MSMEEAAWLPRCLLSQEREVDSEPPLPRPFLHKVPLTASGVDMCLLVVRMGFWLLGQTSLGLSGDILSSKVWGQVQSHTVAETDGRAGCPSRPPGCWLFFRHGTGTPSVRCSQWHTSAHKCTGWDDQCWQSWSETGPQGQGHWLGGSVSRRGWVHGPSCPCICQVCTALSGEALGLWLEPGSLSVKPNCFWGSHGGVGAGPRGVLSQLLSGGRGWDTEEG